MTAASAPVGDLFASAPTPPRPAPPPPAEPVWPPLCVTCGGKGDFGFGVFPREGRAGTWFCREHKGNAR